MSGMGAAATALTTSRTSTIAAPCLIVSQEPVVARIIRVGFVFPLSQTEPILVGLNMAIVKCTIKERKLQMMTVSVDRLMYSMLFWMVVTGAYGFWRGRVYERKHPKTKKDKGCGNCNSCG